jgi:hypothetical protein
VKWFDWIKNILGYSEPNKGRIDIGVSPSPGNNIAPPSSCHDCPMGIGTKKVQLPNGDLIFVCEKHFQERLNKALPGKYQI